MTTITAYPLAWPAGFPRRNPVTREPGKFRTRLPTALDNVQTSLRLFAADSRRKMTDVVLSSNVTLGATRPADPGVAAWFIWDGMQVCIAVDRYTTVEANLQAIHHIIEARRVELRHGTLALVRAAFSGFRALPAPAGGSWRDVLDLAGPVTAADVERAYRDKAKTAHPDAGGSTEAMQRLTAARCEALGEIAG